MKGLLLLLCLISYCAVSQHVYQVNEVETAAEPSGGVSMLNHFISSNMHLPIREASKGLNSRVFVKGIVELDGSMSGLEIVRGIDSICNKEALRIMSLYSAWKPALVKGAKVRQSLIYPVTFKIDKIANFDSTLHARVYYLDKNEIQTNEAGGAKNRIVLPVDLHGYVNQDIQYQTLKGGKWKTSTTFPVQKSEKWVKTNEGMKRDSILVTQISVPNAELNKYFQEVNLKKDGTLWSYTDYNSHGSPILTKTYYLNGVLKQTDEITEGRLLTTRWFNSGILQSVTESQSEVLKMSPLIIKGVWDQQGNAIVKDGDGWCKLPSESLGGRQVWEEGKVEKDLKTGKWVGKLADSTLVFEEYYDAGNLQNGTSFENGTQTAYSSSIQQPEFAGGITNMYRFLAQNIQYPSNASKSRISGRVMLSFVVCEDGSLCDYKVEKGRGFGLDDEALRVVKKMNGLWEPGRVRGKKVRVKYNLPVNFQLQ
ncbi:energy transducer TonB [Dyadobacter sp. 32]|uniref:TonB family protein n=1 Tax=Dyadobacter sp. 32 TaxID=538966 RepID=UPI0011ED0FC8